MKTGTPPAWRSTTSFDSSPRSVVLVAYPNSDLKTFKKRPALLVQNDQIVTGLRHVVLAFITSNTARTGETRILLTRASQAGRRMGLLANSMIVCDVPQTVATDAVLRTLGDCPVMTDVDEALRATLAL